VAEVADTVVAEADMVVVAADTAGDITDNPTRRVCLSFKMLEASRSATSIGGGSARRRWA
jgi:hypothetical protein